MKMLMVLISAVFSSLSVHAISEMQFNKRLYGYIYWENGLPSQKLSRFPSSWANPDAGDAPDLIIQTGYYNMRFDLDDVDIGYDASSGSDYISALTEDVDRFSDGALLLRVYKNGIAYTANTALVESDNLEARLIESGQYVQRFDHTGLVFKDSRGNELSEKGYFEVTAWPDRVVFTLDFSEHASIERATIQVTSTNGLNHLLDRGEKKISLSIKPQSNIKVSDLAVSQYILEARHKNTNTDVAVSFDQESSAFRFDLPTTNTNYPADIDLYDEYVFTVNNPTSNSVNIPLVFSEKNVRRITGTVMTLVEDDDGRPTGHPVQISKNWHSVAGTPIKHDGPWLRGSTMLTLPANASKTLRLRVIYGYWGQVAAASHSQLSLIGWRENGTSWQWDESALGAWGESMTFDPYMAIAGAFIADVRPTFTTPMSASTDHNWTPNYGGGNFLSYVDNNGDFRWTKKLKTAYRWTGPNMTEVLYSGVTDDDAIRFTYTTQLVGSNDYHRRFQKYRYDILKTISPSRLSYYQMSANYYFSASLDTFFMGTASTLTNAVTAENGGNEYKNRMLLSNRWLASDDVSANYGDFDALANRGLLWRESTVNGSSSSAYIHTYGRTWGVDSLLFEVGGASLNQTYTKGTIIEGELEQIMPAEDLSSYWGYDDDFSSRLSASTQPWEMVQQEYLYNTFQPSVRIGSLEKNYPVTIIAATSSNLLAEFTVPANRGVGHIPIIIKDAPAGLALRSQYKLAGSNSWNWAVEDTGYISQNEFYQGYLNANGRMDYVFNISRPYASLSKAITIRIFYDGSNPVSNSIVHMTKRSAMSFAIDGNHDGADGQDVYLYNANPNNRNQQWIELNRGSGYYSYQKNGTEYCLDGGHGGSNGQNVYLWSCSDSNQNQHWKKVNVGGRYHRLEKRNAPGYSIDGNRGGGNLQSIYLWGSSDVNVNQQWFFSKTQ